MLDSLSWPKEFSEQFVGIKTFIEATHFTRSKPFVFPLKSA